MDEIWIIGSGPGLNRVDVRKLKDKATFAFNRSYIAWESWGFAPQHYAVIDLRVMASIGKDIQKIINDSRCESYHFYDGTVEGLARVIEEGPGISYYQLRDGWGFDPEHPYYCGDVAAFSLQAAYRMGHRRAFVVGVDLIWQERPKLAFDADGYRVASKDNDINHFRQDYYPAWMGYSQPYPEAHYYSWEQSVQDAGRYGMEIISCGPGSKLNEMVEYREFDECV